MTKDEAEGSEYKMDTSVEVEVESGSEEESEDPGEEAEKK